MGGGGEHAKLHSGIAKVRQHAALKQGLTHPSTVTCQPALALNDSSRRTAQHPVPLDFVCRPTT